jgi:hypothetical protein
MNQKVNHSMLKRLCVAVSLLAAMSCGEGTSPTTATSSRARLTMSVAPSPITAERCSPQCLSDSGTGFAFSAALTITLQESAGIGARINSITLTGSTGSVTFDPLVFGSTEIAREAGSNHVSARGSLAVPLNIVYTTPAGTPNLTISISADVTDDQNNQVTATGQVNVI